MSLITPDFGLIFWMVIIFGILFFILAKFGFPIITGMVDRRSERISESIRKADEAEARLAGLSQEQQQMIAETRLEQSRILKEATETRQAIIEQARADASAESARILAHTKMEIAAERESAMRQLRAQMASLSVQVAEKIVRKDLETSSDQLALIDRMVDEASQAEVS